MAKRKKESAKPSTKKATPKPHNGLVAFFANSPLVGSAIDLERKPDYGRKIDFGETD